ncbi:asparagine synthase (glutamine-hydrolyzing) [Nocardioides cavernae]|uniref:asparagine synthase (glutamine-hydrolyzing) n=1 Tax=Nocardioides cavernae TaxID=1921566 RepID=A0A7Y9H041_9ACTN|nr:asparagine synthase (glutamine-hydrolyzing) [Nocardioides cavernae]NYE35510.1 asparagine synthase (glutamine-hydrolyzing) [Nocardioides cavernae]
MGGIAGVRVFSGDGVAEATLVEMAERLRHRGPDASGTWVGPDVGLAHARLAIIDDEHARQPMLSADGRWALVLDGEILNHESLRTHLDHPFRTRGDAEVVLAGLALEGISFVERLRGQFAFVAHDLRTGATHLVRDRLGILPLHYRHVPGGLAFASEVKALLVVGPAAALDHRSLDAFLATRTVPAPDTLFEGVKKVRPAHRVAISAGGHVEEVPYWVPPECDPDGTWSAGDAVEAVGDGVREAVRTALAADVPLGVHLSGGLDSSLVAAQAQQLRGDDHLHSFAVASDGETDPARRVADLLGTRHHEVAVRADELDALWTRLTWHRDAPIAETEDVEAFALARAAREHVGVVLSGDGGDELFGGHGRYRYARLAERAHVLPALVRTGLAGPVERRLGATFTSAERQRLLGVAPPPDRRTSAASGADAVDRMLRHDLRHDLPDHLLERADRMSKAASLEVRPALLDHRLVELAFRLPTSLKVRAGSTQWVLREAARPLLPDEVIDARPTRRHHALLDAGVRDLLHDRLTGTGSWVATTLDPDVVSGLLLHSGGSGEVDARLWTLLGLEVWHDCFLGTAPALPRPRQSAPSYVHGS